MGSVALWLLGPPLVIVQIRPKTESVCSVMSMRWRPVGRSAPTYSFFRMTQRATASFFAFRSASTSAK
jgi:hypothetical protein